MFLTPDELTELTGLKLPACQRRWLMRNGYSFDVDANGRAKVLRQYVEQRLGFIDRDKASTIQPNYDVIRKNKQRH